MEAQPELAAPGAPHRGESVHIKTGSMVALATQKCALSPSVPVIRQFLPNCVTIISPLIWLQISNRIIAYKVTCQIDD